MSEKVKDFVSPDAIINKLYEAAPTLTWHVAPSAESFVRCAIDFMVRAPEYFGWQHLPPDCIGRLTGGWVYIDAELDGRTIELRSGDAVLSSITLE